MTHPELIVARRNIALGKLIAFDCECSRLACLVRAGVVTVADAVATLAEADTANDLSCTFGADFVQNIMVDAFAAGMYGANRQHIEVAA